MKAAAAVLGASLLLFLGLVTGAGRREAVPPPTAIPLGVTRPAAGGPSGATSPSSPEPPTGPARTTPSPTPKPSTTTTVPMAATVTTATTAPTAATGTTAPAATATTAGPGQVEPVDNQVDCTSTGKRGQGHRAGCPSTTTSTGANAGGGSGG